MQPMHSPNLVDGRESEPRHAPEQMHPLPCTRPASSVWASRGAGAKGAVLEYYRDSYPPTRSGPPDRPRNSTPACQDVTTEKEGKGNVSPGNERADGKPGEDQKEHSGTEPCLAPSRAPSTGREKRGNDRITVPQLLVNGTR